VDKWLSSFFGFYSWGMPFVQLYMELAEKVIETHNDFKHQKIKQLL